MYCLNLFHLIRYLLLLSRRRARIILSPFMTEENKFSFATLSLPLFFRCFVAPLSLLLLAQQHQLLRHHPLDAAAYILHIFLQLFLFALFLFVCLTARYQAPEYISSSHTFRFALATLRALRVLLQRIFPAFPRHWFFSSLSLSRSLSFSPRF